MTMKTFGRGYPWTAMLSTVAIVHILDHLRGADAHGFLTAPKVEFRTTDEDITAYSATIDGPTALPVPAGMHYDWGPSLATDAFTAAFGNSSYTTLREFVMKHQTLQPSKAISPECGRTNGDAQVPQPLPDMVVWEHGDNEGFTLSHDGPCEVWCDDERVFAETNCAKTYPHVPAKLPYERAKCVGKTRLQMVWLALHENPRWQVYMNCAPLAIAVATPPTADTPLSMDTASSAGSGNGQTAASSSPTPTASTTLRVKTTTPSATIHAYTQVVTRPPATFAAFNSSPTMSPLVSAPRRNTKTPSAAIDEYSNDATSRPPAARPITHPSSVATTPPMDHEEASGVEDIERVEGSWTRPMQPPHPSKPSKRPYTHPPGRRMSEKDDDNSGSHAALQDTESGNSYAEKATGPIPEEIFKEARRDFEAEETRKEERRKLLKKEFGYV